jgi:hypothetical protein
LIGLRFYIFITLAAFYVNQPIIDVKLIKTISRILKAIAYGMRDSQKTAKVTVFSNLQKIFPVLSQYLQRAGKSIL